MTRSFDEARLRQAMADALQSVDQVRLQAEARSGPPAPGDLYVLPLRAGVPVEWLVVRAHPEQPDQLFVIPVDEAPLAGIPDVPLPRNLVHRALTARCGQGAWVRAGLLSARRRVGAVGPEALQLVRAGVARLVRGELEADPAREQADDDPHHIRWMAQLEQARLELEERAARRPNVVPLRLFLPEPPPEIASRTELATAARASGGLIGGLEQALDRVDQSLRFHEVDGAGPGKLFLAADDRGVRAFWVGDAEALPLLRFRHPTQGAQQVTWRKTVPDRSVFLAEPAFDWVDGRVVLRLGKAPSRKVVIQR